jgi:hypothetical protein
MPKKRYTNLTEITFTDDVAASAWHKSNSGDIGFAVPARAMMRPSHGLVVRPMDTDAPPTKAPRTNESSISPDNDKS